MERDALCFRVVRPSVRMLVRACVPGTDCCIHTSDIARRQHLRSSGCHQLFVPRHRRSMFGRRAFSVAGPAACNSLPDYRRDPSRSCDSCRRDLKTFLVLLAYTAHWRLCDFALYKPTNDIDIDILRSACHGFLVCFIAPPICVTNGAL